jgi:hypothetical protein
MSKHLIAVLAVPQSLRQGQADGRSLPALHCRFRPSPKKGTGRSDKVLPLRLATNPSSPSLQAGAKVRSPVAVEVVGEGERTLVPSSRARMRLSSCFSCAIVPQTPFGATDRAYPLGRARASALNGFGTARKAGFNMTNGIEVAQSVPIREAGFDDYWLQD